MSRADYSLFVSPDNRARLARAWLMLGLFALLASGLFALLLVLARTPYLQAIVPWTDFFHTALIVHVDLSVLVWFIAFGGVLWSLNSTGRYLSVGWVALVFAVVGTVAMAVAPFAAESNPLINNYVPVLQQPAFLAGLGLFGFGATVLVLRTLSALPTIGPNAEGASALRFGLLVAVITAAVALMAFVWSIAAVPSALIGRAYYELLFWGGGHVLQFVYTLLMLVAWLWLASASGVALALSARAAIFILALGFAPVLAVPLAYFSYSVTSAQHVVFFTLHMQYGGGLAAAALALIVLYGMVRAPAAVGTQQPLRAALISSVLLSSVGGVIGFLIRGANVTIPAHYHGSIVGVTLAFMGLTYCLLPRLGYGEPSRRWAFVQPWIYGGGQLLHIAGLAWSGGYGVQRKVAGAAQGLEGIERVTAMGLMGLGGLIAILGGLLFLIVVFHSMWRRPRE